MDRRAIALERGHDACKNHQAYALTCAQYNALLVRSADACEICGRPSAESHWGKLAIDHDARIGQWAVRGLLCHDCNTNMRRIPANDPRLLAYLDSAWYLDALAQAGIRLGIYPEPDLRTIVGEPTGRHWKRYKRGWVVLNRYPYNHGAVETWQRILYRHGPLNLHHHPPRDRRNVPFCRPDNGSRSSIGLDSHVSTRKIRVR